MEKRSLGFIGGGRVTRIFLQAFKNKQYETGKVIIYDPNNETLTSLKDRFPGIEIVDSPDAAFSQEIVFIAVHPPVLMDTLEKMKQFVTGDTIVVSLAPKVNISKIAAKLDTDNIVRMIPNATSYINEGYNPLCFSMDFKAEKSVLFDMLNVLGNTFEVPEDKLEAYAIVSAMLPTYFWFQWKALTDLGVRMGMGQNEADDAVYETVIASLNTLFKSGEDAGSVMDLIPVKPIGDYEGQITKIYEEKLLALFEKIRP